ncbi:MAG: UDP-N-acetylmuramoyl-L-alanine--D-glutamate ligase [Spirochaetales bacterium]|nr:UDP-N-acetylmuramoyl-L-alanine--D-glutamate ligase [Spirochaetales bacterium]
MNDKLNRFLERIKGKKVLIQGLGLNKGGTGIASFFIKHGVPIKITDLKTETELGPSISELDNLGGDVTYVLGKHNIEDFIDADIVVKGPAVSPENEYIKAAIDNGAEILSDLSIFMENCPTEKLFAVTGSKGKSTTVSVLYSILSAYTKNCFLGGNISISPLSFLDELNEESLVVLELSSWQLRDLELAKANVRFPYVIFTNLMHDHQNYYNSMEKYLADKLIIAKYQCENDLLFIPQRDSYIKKDLFCNGQKILCFGEKGDTADVYFDDGVGYCHEKALFNDEKIQVPGEHIRNNLLAAAALCHLALNIDKETLSKGIENFHGVPFRMEKIREWNNVTFINDTTATIPEAAVCAVKSIDTKSLVWIGGGTDKNLDFACIKEIEAIPRMIYLLKGTGTDKMKNVMSRNDVTEASSLEDVFSDMLPKLKAGDVVLLSPGCTSFGLFQNEFHRGRVFNECVNKL